MGGGWGTRADWRRIPATASTGPNRDLRVSFLCFSNAAPLSPPSPHPCAAPLPQCLGGETAAAPCLGPAYICRVEPRTTIDGPAPTSSPPRRRAVNPRVSRGRGDGPWGAPRTARRGRAAARVPLPPSMLGRGGGGPTFPTDPFLARPLPPFPPFSSKLPRRSGGGCGGRGCRPSAATSPRHCRRGVGARGEGGEVADATACGRNSNARRALQPSRRARGRGRTPPPSRWRWRGVEDVGGRPPQRLRRAAPVEGVSEGTLPLSGCSPRRANAHWLGD